MFVDSLSGEATDKSITGHLASGVPGAVAGLLTTLERYGSMSRAQVLAPALRLARDGFVVDTAFVRTLRADSARICRFAGCETFFPGGPALKPGDTLRQPELARTLARIIAEGSNGFYRGSVAKAIAVEMKKGDGLITEADLAGYASVWRTPVEGAYHGHTLISMPPSSSGGVTLIETLNILGAFGSVEAFGSVTRLHRLLGSFQLSFIDRNAYLADPDAMPVPVQALTSQDYARRQRARLDDARYIPTPQLKPGLDVGTPSPGSRPEAGMSIRESDQTTHYSVVDRFGNAVATTTTVNGLFGSAVWVPEAGFFMNNEMDDFAAQPGKPNQFGLVQGEANAVAPRKRMLSAMSPTIVLDPRQNVLLVVGSRGGPRIITGVAQVVINVIDYEMSLADAMAAPRVHFQGLPEVVSFERGGFAQPVLDSLTAMGWRFERGSSGSPVAIKRTASGWEGTWDPRAAGGVAGR